MRTFLAKAVVCLLLTVLVPSVACADAPLELARLFSEGMILQQEAPVPVWGWAEPGAEVEVGIAGQSHKTVPDDSGKWTVTLDPLSVGEPLTMKVTAGDSAISITGILVGEVWLCSGQSNMWWTVSRSADAEREVATANYPNLRMFTVRQTYSADAPVADCEGAWLPATSENVGDFSAAAYYFGRRLHKELNVPVGLISTSVGGTAAEAWTSREVLESDPAFALTFEYWGKKVKNWDPAAAAKRDAERLEQWKAVVAKAKADGTTPPRRPRKSIAPKDDRNYFSTLFNGMIYPLIPYAIRGAIWYQGESNAGRPEQYHKLFPAMIGDWRSRWAQGDFPFYYVQLANFITPRRWGPDTTIWAYLREAQTATLKTPNTGMAVTIDIGDPKNIHPKNKQDVGARLARWALAKQYGRDIAYSGPLYKSATIEDGKVRISFDYAEGLRTRGGELEGFIIAGVDRIFVTAQAKIEGDTVLVWSPQVPEPAAVRYAWDNNPVDANLMNAAALPASGFRADAWPRIVPGKK